MTFPKSSNPLANPRRWRSGFTLVEILISAALFIVLVTVVLSMVVFQTRFGVSVGNYSEMNTASRQVMNIFEADMRLVRSVNTSEPRKLVVQVLQPSLSVKEVVYAGSAATVTVTYDYDASSKKLTRNGTVLLSNLDDCQFMYFNALDAPTTNTTGIKKVLLAATMRKSLTGGTGGLATSDYLVSAVVTMRCRNNN